MASAIPKARAASAAVDKGNAAGDATDFSRLLPAARDTVARILERAGVRIGGGNAWDIRVHDERFYRRLLMKGSLGAGESYMDGWWDVQDLDDFFRRVHEADLDLAVGRPIAWWRQWKSRLMNLQTAARSRHVAEDHYDLGAGLFAAMLDRNMQYTCAYWKDASTLDEAQQAKLDLIRRKLQLEPGMRVLELGGGFGGLARYLAERCGCEVVSYNISGEQVAYGRRWCEGLPVRFEQKDYREAAGERRAFDRVVSVGLCEHIGHKNYRGFLLLVRRLLARGGLFLLHTIGGNRTVTAVDPWIDKYIFRNGVIPSLGQLSRAMEGVWVVEDLHNFGPDYDRTLMCWWRNFERAWPELRSRYGERFHRMWRYYLLSSAGAFRARKLQLWQFVLSQGDIPRYLPER